MADTEIKITFAEEKMEALTFFLKEKNESVESVLKAHLDKIYDKNVPEPVKKFIQRGQEGQEAGTAPEPVRAQRQARESARRTARQSARQAATGPAEGDTPESEESLAVSEEQTEGTGMSMGM